jgi:hypothetical protein
LLVLLLVLVSSGSSVSERHLMLKLSLNKLKLLSTHIFWKHHEHVRINVILP